MGDDKNLLDRAVRAFAAGLAAGDHASAERLLALALSIAEEMVSHPA